MDVSTAQLGIWTIARFAALAVIVTETLFLIFRRRDPLHAAEAPASTRFYWAVTPALLLAGLAFWCLVSVAQDSAAGPVLAQLSH